MKIFIRFEIHHHNYNTKNIRYIYHDKNKNTSLSTLNIKNNNSAALTLRAYSDWIGIGDTDQYDLKNENMWHIRELHPYYKENMDKNKTKNIMNLGDRLCVRISFAMPEEIVGHINSDGIIYQHKIDHLVDTINNHCTGSVNNDNSVINDILKDYDNGKIYWAKFLNCFIDINTLNLRLKIDNTPNNCTIECKNDQYINNHIETYSDFKSNEICFDYDLDSELDSDPDYE